MAHQEQNLKIHAGDDLVIPVTVTDDGTASGTPIDITGALKIVWAMATNDGEDTRVLTKEIGSGVEITDAAAGEFEVTIADTDTISLSGKYKHVARVTDSNGLKTTVLDGILTVWPTFLASDE